MSLTFCSILPIQFSNTTSNQSNERDRERNREKTHKKIFRIIMNISLLPILSVTKEFLCCHFHIYHIQFIYHFAIYTRTHDDFMWHFSVWRWLCCLWPSFTFVIFFSACHLIEKSTSMKIYTTILAMLLLLTISWNSCQLVFCCRCYVYILRK